MDPLVWQMFLRFVDFWETHKPTLIETEVHLFSDELKIAGTCDCICEIDGELWVIDFKTLFVYFIIAESFNYILSHIFNKILSIF